MGKKNKKNRKKQFIQEMQIAQQQRISELLEVITLADIELLLSRYGHGLGIGPLQGPEDEIERKPRHKMGFQPNDD